MLEAKNIRKSFGKLQVLNSVDLKVDKNEVVVIIGSSGSGKTTLLRCLNFLEHADEGELTIDDIHVDFPSVSRKNIYNLRRKTAMVFQNYNLFNNKTVLQNVSEGLIVARKVPKAEAVDRALAMLEKVGLEDKLNEYPCYLSGGQQQRVGIARAIALEPQLILFDEPTSSLDPELVGECLKYIRKVAEEGIPLIIVTHEMSFAYDIATKVVFIDKGVVAEQGSAREVLLNPREERTRQFLARFSFDSQYTI